MVNRSGLASTPDAGPEGPAGTRTARAAALPWLDRACVIIPAYQAAKTLPGVIADLRRALPTLAGEILVIDDGSRDGTAEAAALAGCQLVSHGKNRGKGAALMTGLATARGAPRPARGERSVCARARPP